MGLFALQLSGKMKASSQRVSCQHDYLLTCKMPGAPELLRSLRMAWRRG